MKFLIVIAIVAIACFVPSQAAKNRLTGINLSGADFGSAIPGRAGHDYFFPTETQMDYFLNRSMNVIRFPISWERIQPKVNEPLTTEYANSVLTVAKHITGKGKYFIIDVHNYQKYFGDVVGESGVTIAHLVDLYTKLYALLSPLGEKVIWGIMNEPLGKSHETWVTACQAVIDKLRALGSKELILVPGLGYTGAASWGRSRNMDTMWNVTDPLNNIAIEIHMYADRDSSGTNETCVSANIGIESLHFITGWLKAYGRQGFLGEVGMARNSLCYQTITNTFKFLEANSDVWLGWTWWAGGPGWGDYMFTLSPLLDGSTAPQWQYLSPFITATTPANIALNSYTRAGDVRIPIYDGVLNIFDDGSWATDITRQDASKTYSSDYSYSFVPGGPISNAMQWRTRTVLDTTKYEGIEFYAWSTGNLSRLEIQLVDFDGRDWKAVPDTKSNLLSLATGPDANGWYKVFMSFENFDGEAHNGLMIMGGSSAKPKLFIDQMVLIHHFAKDYMNPNYSPSSTTTTATTTVSTTVATTVSATDGDAIEDSSSSFVSSSFFLVVVALLICSF